MFDCVAFGAGADVKLFLPAFSHPRIRRPARELLVGRLDRARDAQINDKSQIDRKSCSRKVEYIECCHIKPYVASKRDEAAFYTFLYTDHVTLLMLIQCIALTRLASELCEPACIEHRSGRSCGDHPYPAPQVNSWESNTQTAYAHLFCPHATTILNNLLRGNVRSLKKASSLLSEANI